MITLDRPTLTARTLEDVSASALVVGVGTGPDGPVPPWIWWRQLVPPATIRLSALSRRGDQGPGSASGGDI